MMFKEFEIFSHCATFRSFIYAPTHALTNTFFMHNIIERYFVCPLLLYQQKYYIHHHHLPLIVISVHNIIALVKRRATYVQVKNYIKCAFQLMFRSLHETHEIKRDSMESWTYRYTFEKLH